MATKAKAKAKKVTNPTGRKGMGVGKAAREALLAGATNEEALEAVRAAVPSATTGIASIRWYRNKMRSEGLDVPSARELKAKKAS